MKKTKIIQQSEATNQPSETEEKVKEAPPTPSTNVINKNAKKKTHKKNNYNKQNMKKTNRVKNRISFNIDKESKKKRTTRRNRNEKDGRTINASLRIKNRTLTPMPMPTTAT